MSRNNYIFTSESVSAGHPDKVADQISDALVDAGLENGDKTTRIALETLVTTNHVTVAGEVKNFNIGEAGVNTIIRSKIKEIGYEQDGFHWDNVEIVNKIHAQSVDIALGTDDFGAGDQGIMFGYACNDNESYMPAPIYYAHEILNQLKESQGIIILPDQKSQVSIEYSGGVPVRADQVVISSQHTKGNVDKAREICRHVATSVLGDLVDDKTIWHLNPTGKFEIGGPDGDTGLTGRKIIVDTYGGYARHGGGAFSGKDPSKVDRSASYMARYVAKNIVAADLAERCEVQLAYSIGVAEPVSFTVDTFGTGILPDEELVNSIQRVFNLRPSGIISTLKLKAPIYKALSAYGHFGREGLPWEKTDKIEELKQEIDMEVSVG